MTEKEIVDKMVAVYQYIHDNINEAFYYEKIKKMVLKINQDFINEKIEGLSRFQKIHLMNWICNLVNACEFALTIYENPTKFNEKRIHLQEMVSALLDQSHNSFNLFKKSNDFLKTYN